MVQNLETPGLSGRVDNPAIEYKKVIEIREKGVQCFVL